MSFCIAENFAVSEIFTNQLFHIIFQELPCRAVHGAELPDAIKQTKDYAWRLLARPRWRLALI